MWLDEIFTIPAIFLQNSTILVKFLCIDYQLVITIYFLFSLVFVPCFLFTYIFTS